MTKRPQGVGLPLGLARAEDSRACAAPVFVVPESLKSFCSLDRRLTADDLDLLWVAGHVAWRDRNQPRHRSTGWLRRLDFEVPVTHPELWNRAPVRDSLQRCLAFLTGDQWTLRFVPRSSPVNTQIQLQLLHSHDDFAAVQPFSGGMDSFATAALLANEGTPPLLVTTDVSPTVASLADSTLKSRRYPIESVKVRVRLAARSGAQERSYRTRTFLYYSIAAVAARLARIDRIILSEPGQGAVGPSLVAFAGEHPVRGMHPGFARHLRQFLGHLWDQAPRFEHRNLWSTKAQLITEFLRVGSAGQLRATRSCSRDPARERRRRGLPPACGICGGCLFRRMSVVAAGLPDDPEQYVWGDLHCPDLANSSRHGLSAWPIDREVAAHALVAMRDLAALADPPRCPSVERTCRELAEALDIPALDIRDRLQSLVATHSDEWNVFLKHCGAGSWIAKIGR